MKQSKLILLTDRLEKLGAFDSKPNKVALNMTKILDDDVPYTMALTIANYTMATFIGHFHHKLALTEKNKVPLNVIAFILAKSGAKKTSSMITLKKSLAKGYYEIDKYRYNKAKALMETHELTEMPYIPPLDNALATEAGMVQRLNDFKREGIGLPSLYVDEISTELASNADMIPNIKLVAQLFDDGDYLSKPLKDRKNQSDEVKGMGMNALFIGSEHGILEDATVLTKFETEFISKLARRSIFVYPQFKDEIDEATDVEEMLEELEIKEESSEECIDYVNDISEKVARMAILNDTNEIGLSDKASVLWKTYMLYCKYKSKVGDQPEAVVLEMQHRHWKALKLAGVYAVFNMHNVIEDTDYMEALHTVEISGRDISTFIEKANRLPYEILLSHYEQGGADMTPHEMVKKKWINRLSDVKTILELANSKSGDTGMLTYNGEDGLVQYQSFIKQDGFGLSYKRTENLELLIDSGVGRREAKGRLAKKTADGFKFYSVEDFKDAIKVMRNDTAYSPFRYRDGIRGKEHIVGGCDFIVLDVDDTDVPWNECFDMLGDYNCAIALGSDKNNVYKYRVMLPTDINVDLPPEKWKPFMKKVSEYLGIPIDLLPQSQFYFGYKGRDILINEDGENLEASELIKNIDVSAPKVKPLKSHLIDDAWDERMHLFSNAYRANKKTGLHNQIWYATVSAHNMGFRLEQGLALLDDIIDYIDDEPRRGYVDTLKKRMISNNSDYPHWVQERKDAEGVV